MVRDVSDEGGFSAKIPPKRWPIRGKDEEEILLEKNFFYDAATHLISFEHRLKKRSYIVNIWRGRGARSLEALPSEEGHFQYEVGGKKRKRTGLRYSGGAGLTALIKKRCRGTKVWKESGKKAAEGSVTLGKGKPLW